VSRTVRRESRNVNVAERLYHLIASSKPRSTFDAVSQLDRDTSIALATIREWRNSFVPVNRIPSEVLSLIPTHLSHDKHLYSASSVCSHWRRTFIQHAALWSQLDLRRKRSNLVEILLERAKGSALDVRASYLDRVTTLALLSPHAQQFKSLDLTFDYWSNIQKFSEATSGPLPLLHTLQISVIDTTVPPSLPLFSGAVNLKNFSLRSGGIPFLNHFAFPNLTTFEFLAVGDEFPISQLLNFLEALPTLQTICMKIEAEVLRGDVPPERVVVLPNVKIFSVTEGKPGYGIAPHISCPSARRMALVREQDVEALMPEEIFPDWDTIGPQHMASTIDEVALGITTTGDELVSFSLSFSSPRLVTLELGYRITTEIEDCDELVLSYGWRYTEVFEYAFEAIRTYPLLNNIKRLRIWDRHHLANPRQLTSMAKEAAGLFGFVGPLEELVLDIDDLRLFLSPFSDLPESQVSTEQSTFPSIKGLIIVEQLEDPFDEECVAAIVGFVRSQYMRGVPFERAVFHIKSPPAGMVERLEPWVCTVDISEETISGGDPGAM